MPGRKTTVNGRRTIRDEFRTEDGYALASMLYLIVILSLLASSIITIQQFRKRVALKEVAQVKAEYAAESGVAMALAHLERREEISRILSRSREEFAFEDGGRATVEIHAWGVFLRVRSEGAFRQTKALRIALAADRPSEAFSNALVFGNESHQLVFAGAASVEGDVIVGQPGVTVGNLRDRSSPSQIPIKGSIRRTPSPEVPSFEAPQLSQELASYNTLLHEAAAGTGQTSHSLRFESEYRTIIRSETIPDSISSVFVKGEATLHGTAFRLDAPLYIAVDGPILIAGNARLSGLIAVLASGEIEVSSDVMLDQVILYSLDSIKISARSNISSQMISGSIMLDEHAVARYPSVLLSTQLRSSHDLSRAIILKDNAKVEGLIALTVDRADAREEELVNVHATASVVGAVVSNARLTLDGTVAGTVMTEDFYFYEPPTSYLGWLRSGRIDRNKLPSSFFVPPGFSDELRLDVLDWL